MAEYNKTRFYWLQLKEDFFDEDAIDWLEDQPNGKEYSLFYLKLCLKSLRTNGMLIRKVGNLLVPYDHIKLGELTKTNPDTVLVAMELLLKIGLVQKLENGELYIKQVENMIGSQSVGAFKKQQRRMLGKNTFLLEEGQQGGQKGDKCPPDIDIEKELKLDIDKKEKNTTETASVADDEFEILWKMYPNKKGKPNALKAYKKARKNGVAFEDIKQGLENYIKYCEASKTEPQYIKHGSTWFNQQCWTDEYNLTKQGGKASGRNEKVNSGLAKWIKENTL